METIFLLSLAIIFYAGTLVTLFKYGRETVGLQERFLHSLESTRQDKQKEETPEAGSPVIINFITVVGGETRDFQITRAHRFSFENGSDDLLN
ncbi:MAG: hypothetical protein AB1523_01570 [Bacillota bacterium]